MVKLKTAALSLSSTFKTAVTSVVISFNDGAKGLSPIFDQLGIEPDHYTIHQTTISNKIPLLEIRSYLRLKNKFCKKHFFQYIFLLDIIMR